MAMGMVMVMGMERGQVKEKENLGVEDLGQV